jgi:hypothetical protein
MVEVKRMFVAKSLSRVLWLPLLVVPVMAQISPTDVVTAGAYENREYRAENGRRIRISSRGNLTALEAPYGFEHLDQGGRAREGYVISYDDPATGAIRVLHDVNDLYSRTLGGFRDLVPVSFRGPAAGTSFAAGTPVTATVIVDTLDGALRLAHHFEWRAGFGNVRVTTTVTNRLAGYVTLRGFKRMADMNLDGAGAYGVALTNDWVRADNSILISIRCLCSPPIPPSPLTPEFVSLHAMSFSGAPAPAYKTINRAGDLAELSSIGPAAGSDLPGARRGENNQATLIWAGSRLAPGASQSFTAEYQVE